MGNLRAEYLRHKDLEDSLQVTKWNASEQAIWHYHRKALLPGEISVPSAGDRGLTSIVSGVLGLFPLAKVLIQQGSVFFRLDRANLSSPKTVDAREIIIQEKANHAFTPSVMHAGYLVRLILRIVMLPGAAVGSRRINKILVARGLFPVSLRLAAAALGDRLFCHFIVLLKTRCGTDTESKILFCAAIVPDAHLYASPAHFVEVAHGVIHFGHPSLFNLWREATLFVVPDERSRAICEENTSNGQFSVDRRFFSTFFFKDPAGEKVFIAQPGEPFEQIAERFLSNRPDWKVRPHPRSSATFIEAHRTRIEMGGMVSQVASVSSTMLNDATQVGISMTVVRSKIVAENDKLETSFEGLLLPAQYEVSYV